MRGGVVGMSTGGTGNSGPSKKEAVKIELLGGAVRMSRLLALVAAANQKLPPPHFLEATIQEPGSHLLATVYSVTEKDEL